MFLANTEHNMKKLFLILVVAFAACQSQQQVASVQSEFYRIHRDSIKPDERILKTIAPYKNKLDSAMNVELILAEGDFSKSQPEGSLGNMVCDVLMQYAKSKNLQADLCLMNNGGLRIPVIYKGQVSVRTVYELMPFENQLVLVKIKGSKFKELMQMLASSGGAPVAGINLLIQDNAIQSLLVQGQPFDEQKEYWVLTSDYLANGGDKYDALKNPIERIDLNLLLRDVLIETLYKMDTDGAHLIPVIDGRIRKN
jgi:2',3'-cyclic-nucleotide 2'-phosphodiesterase (5'-nucleotidase family)